MQCADLEHHTIACGTVCLVPFPPACVQANLFQPTQQLLDMKREKQREMERAFEKPCLKSQGANAVTLQSCYVCTYVLEGYLSVVHAFHWLKTIEV